MRVAPLRVVTVSPHGAFGYQRTAQTGGGCPKGYPCTHPGVDLLAPAGTPVYAPEDGRVVALGDGASPPFTGYGPWVVEILGASGVYHLLAHMSPSTRALAPIGGMVRAGQQVGTVGVNHTHWEVRRLATPGAGRTNMQNNSDPMAWRAGSDGELADIIPIVIVGAAATVAFLWFRR